MDENHKRAGTGMGIAIGALGLLALFAIAGLLVIYTGAYNVAASEQHMSLTRWAFDTTMHRSVEQRAAEVSDPGEATPALLAKGASEYRAMCQHCHAGPGVKREPWAEGMRPRPPHLVEAAAEWQRNEVFWLIKHGVKMSGMPAFGAEHDDETLWAIASFVKQLPAMTPERYATLGEGAHDDGGHSGHGADHGAAAGTAQGASQSAGRQEEHAK